VRAFDPFPGATFQAGSDTVKLWRAQVERLDDAAAPGTVLAVDGQQLVVACGDGALALLDVQRPGGKRGPVAQWLQAHPVQRGSVLG
jgi:methionyl-tRNA formyltransferase